MRGILLQTIKLNFAKEIMRFKEKNKEKERIFFEYALVFSQNSKTALLLKKIAEMPYFFLHSGTPPLALAGYPKK